MKNKTGNNKTAKVGFGMSTYCINIFCMRYTLCQDGSYKEMGMARTKCKYHLNIPMISAELASIPYVSGMASSSANSVDTLQHKA